MSTFDEDNGADRFANGVSNRDLRIHSDAAERDRRFKAQETMSDETDGVDSLSNLQAEKEALSKSENFTAPIGALLGLKLTQPENGLAVVEFDADECYANPVGTLHGGMLCDIADSSNGFRVSQHPL